MPYREFLNGYYKFRKEVYPGLKRVYQDLDTDGQNPQHSSFPAPIAA